MLLRTPLSRGIFQPPAAAVTDDGPRRVLVYTHDTYGLGNIRRMLAVAEALVASDPRIHVLLITGSPMVQGFRVAPRIDFVKLPCLERDEAGRYGVRALPMSLKSLIGLRARLIRDTVRAFRPHLLLVDKKPLGIKGELRPAIEALARLPRRPAMALLLRDILDAPEVTWRVWERHRYHEVLRRHYDLVLVAGQPELFDLAREYRFPLSSRRLVRYCGYIRRLELERCPAAHPVGDGARVLVTVGGGADGAHLIRTYLQGLARGQGRFALRSRIITGPELAADTRAELEALARRVPGQRLETFCEQMPQALAEADLVVSMCGYNSICEVLGSGRRSVVVPRIRPVAEQWIRARRFAAKGLVDLLHPDEVTEERLLQTIDAALAAPPPPVDEVLDMEGLTRITHWVWRLLRLQAEGVAAAPYHSFFHGQRSLAHG